MHWLDFKDASHVCPDTHMCSMLSSWASMFPYRSTLVGELREGKQAAERLGWEDRSWKSLQGLNQTAGMFRAISLIADLTALEANQKFQHASSAPKQQAYPVADR